MPPPVRPSLWQRHCRRTVTGTASPPQSERLAAERQNRVIVHALLQFGKTYICSWNHVHVITHTACREFAEHILLRLPN